MKRATKRVTIRVTAVAAISAAVAAFGPAQAQDVSAVLQYKGKDRTEKLLAGAKKEGKLVFYSAMIANQAIRPLVAGFMKKYPFVKTTYWRAKSEDIVTKTLAEAKAKNVVGDVIEGTGVGELAAQANIVARFYSPELKAYPEKYIDKQGQWAATRLSYYGMAFNTRMLPPDKAPKSFEDLLKPEFKGKISWRIGSASGTPLFLTNLRVAWGEDKAMAYFRKLAGQKMINFGSGSARTLVNRVVAGEYPIAVQIFAHHPLISKAKGAPVDARVFTPVATTAATLVLPTGTKHPHAAMLFVDYVLSKEGQSILRKANYIPVHPDVPTSPKIASVVPKKGVAEENFISPEQLLKYTESSQKIYETMFR